MTMSLWLLVPILFAITFLTRLLPFVLGAKFFEKPILQDIKSQLPAVIIFIVLLYELKDTVWQRFPYAIPEASALLLIAIIHWCFRKEVVSILLGFAWYVLISWLMLHQSINTL